MMQLLCNGVRLDLYESTDIEFTHDNPLFAFDKLSCERTTQFKLPSTPTNDRVLSLSRIPAYAGTGMRRKFAAQLQAGTTIKDGYLYVASYDGTDYAAVFVTGELVGLQAIKDLGKLAEIITYTDTVEVGQNTLTPANGMAYRWANIEYLRPSADIIKPSIRLQTIYNEIAAQYGLNVQALPASIAEYRWIVGSPNGMDEMLSFQCELVGSETQPSLSPQYDFNKLTYYAPFFDTDTTQYIVENISTTLYYQVVQYKAKTNCKIVFPSTFPDDVFMVDLSEISGVYHQPNAGNFYGDYYFTKAFNQAAVASGTPLAGRTIELAKDDCFSFVSYECYEYSRQQVLGQWVYDIGYVLDSANSDFLETYDLTVQSMDKEVPVGDLCRLQDNLPDITFTDFLKVLAYLSGRVLNYSNDNGLTFEEIDMANWSHVEVKDIISRKEVTRTFADYAQHNYVMFDSGDYVLSRLIVDYTIDNDNIETEKTLATIPCSEGQDLDGMTYVEGDNPIISNADANYSNLAMIGLPKNAGLQALCTASTQIKITAHMTMAEYNAITAKTLLLVDNILYVWTSRTWKDDVAEFTLAKIA